MPKFTKRAQDNVMTCIDINATSKRPTDIITPSCVCWGKSGKSDNYLSELLQLNVFPPFITQERDREGEGTLYGLEGGGATFHF